MKTLSDYLDTAKAKSGSDYQTAKILEISRASVSHARKKGSMDVDNCVVLAEFIEVNPAEVIAACHVARHPEALPYWRKWVAGAAIAIIGTASIYPYYEKEYKNQLDIIASNDEYWTFGEILRFIIKTIKKNEACTRC